MWHQGWCAGFELGRLSFKTLLSYDAHLGDLGSVLSQLSLPEKGCCEDKKGGTTCTVLSFTVEVWDINPLRGLILSEEAMPPSP